MMEEQVSEPNGKPNLARYCQLCNRAIAKDHETTTCDQCGATYHTNCWVANEGCYESGCPNEGNNNNKTLHIIASQTKERKKSSSYKLPILIFSLIVLTLLGVIWFKFFLPNKIIDDAQKYLEYGNLDLAFSTLLKAPQNEKTKDLFNKIDLEKAKRLILSGDLEGAESILANLQVDEETTEMINEYHYQHALKSLETGDYKSAFDTLSKIVDYSNTKQLMYQIQCEALALKGILEYKRTLYNPSSLKVNEIKICKNKGNPNGTPVVIVNISGMNRLGGIITVDSLFVGKYMGSYNPSIALDESIENAVIKFMLDDYANQKNIGDYDLNRLNKLLEENAVFNINYIPFDSNPI